jgi:hypothetical protein
MPSRYRWVDDSEAGVAIGAMIMVAGWLLRAVRAR